MLFNIDNICDGASRRQWGVNMNQEVMKQLYDIVCDRKKNPAPNSYTCYLFEKGLDKILKKCGEECAETIIAAKNAASGADSQNIRDEICDLLYHLIVLMAELDIPYSEIEDILRERSLKIGNLKQMKSVDRTS